MKNLLLFALGIFAFSYNCIGQYDNVDFEPAGLGAGWTWVMDQNDDNPPLEFVANPSISGINTTPTTAKFTARQAGQPWALTYTDDIDEFMFDATNNTVTIMVYKTVLSDVAIKFEGSSAPVEIKIANTTVNQWEEISFDFSGSNGNTYNRLIVIPDFDLAGRTQENIIHFDNIQIPDGNVTPPAEPTVGAPVPTHNEVTDNVVSIYSDTYTDLGGTDFNPNWGQTTDQSFVSVAGNPTNKYMNLTYQGTQLTPAQDVSARGYIHVDFWTPNATAIEFYLISATTGERKVDLPVALEQWVSVDIPLHEYVTQGLGIADIHQFKVVGNGNVWFDNWYFHSDYFVPAPIEPLVAAPIPTQDAVNNSVISIFSGAYTDIGGTDFDPNWGQATDATVVDISGNSTLKYANLNYQGTQYANQDVSGLDFLHVDFWTNNSTDLGIYLISPGNEIEYVFTVVADQWNSIDIPLTHFTPPVNLADVFQFKVEGNGTIWFDNLFFYALAPLPIELVAFEADVKNNQVELTWETASEFNNDYFQIERSTDGEKFETLATVPSKGNSASSQSYSILDSNPKAAVNYYRLKQVDRDGELSKSAKISASINSANPIELIRKAVVADQVQLAYQVDKPGNYQIQFIDLNGRIIVQQDLTFTKGVNNIDLAIPYNGVLITVLSNEQNRLVEKVFK